MLTQTRENFGTVGPQIWVSLELEEQQEVKY